MSTNLGATSGGGVLGGGTHLKLILCTCCIFMKLVGIGRDYFKTLFAMVVCPASGQCLFLRSPLKKSTFGQGLSCCITLFTSLL